jgi:hypothetical protein
LVSSGLFFKINGSNCDISFGFSFSALGKVLRFSKYFTQGRICQRPETNNEIDPSKMVKILPGLHRWLLHHECTMAKHPRNAHRSQFSLSMRKFRRLWNHKVDQNLGPEPASTSEKTKQSKNKMTVLRLNAFYSGDKIIRIQALDIYGHNKEDKFGEEIRELFGLIRLHT